MPESANGSGADSGRVLIRAAGMGAFFLCAAAAAAALNWQQLRPVLVGTVAEAPAPPAPPAPAPAQPAPAATGPVETVPIETAPAEKPQPAPPVDAVEVEAPEFYMPDTDPEPVRAAPVPVTVKPRPGPARKVAAAVPFAAPRAGGAKPPEFLNRELRYLSEAELVCRAAERWLLTPKGECPKRAVFVIGEKAEGPKSPPAPEQAEVRVCYDKEFLYVAYKALDKDLDGLVRNGTETGEKLWLDDSIELFLDVKRDYGTYYQLIINVDGARFEHDGEGGTPETPGLEVATKAAGKAWIVEIALPLKAMGAADTKAGIAWGANFIRNGYVKDEYYGSSWAHLRSGSNHLPAEYGFIIFK